MDMTIESRSINRSDLIFSINLKEEVEMGWRWRWCGDDNWKEEMTCMHDWLHDGVEMTIGKRSDISPNDNPSTPNRSLSYGYITFQLKNLCKIFVA